MKEKSHIPTKPSPLKSIGLSYEYSTGYTLGSTWRLYSRLELDFTSNKASVCGTKWSNCLDYKRQCWLCIEVVYDRLGRSHWRLGCISRASLGESCFPFFRPVGMLIEITETSSRRIYLWTNGISQPLNSCYERDNDSLICIQRQASKIYIGDFCIYRTYGQNLTMRRC